ncbi:MAG: RsmB/NOP family class I SAM-dependent RNA methyltransferase, partial [Myxococcota bacterium]
MNPGRVAALRALIAVEEGAHAEDILPTVAPTTGPDRGLAWHITLGTLRYQGRIDQTLTPFLRRPLNKLDPGVRNALRLGVFEAQVSQTPAHAAVSQAVEACRAIGLGRATSMVNAVLRKAIQKPISSDPFDGLPAWLQQRWSAYGDWVKRLHEPVPVCLRSPSKPIDSATPVTLDGQIVPDLWSLPTGSGSILNIDAYQQGQAWVMDPSAAKVADIVQAALGGQGTVLDACAAPGGKTMRMASHGLNVTAVDLSESRLERLQTNLDRLSISASVLQHDWLTGPLPKGDTYDAVLVDAPCTGLGTIRRHPEIIWRRLPADPQAMGIRQRQILSNAATHVCPGGVLVYAVCSPEPEEGPQVVADMTGWEVTEQWCSVPPSADEDAFQSFVLRRTG